MPRRKSVFIELTMPQRRLLGKWHKGTLSTRFSRRFMIRADVIMRAARGQTNYMIAKQLGVSRNTVKLWRYRFAREGLQGLMTRPIPGRPPKQRHQETFEQMPTASLNGGRLQQQLEPASAILEVAGVS